MSGPEPELPFRQRSICARGSNKRKFHPEAAVLLRAKQEEKVSLVPSLAERSSLFKPVQCMTELLRQCISAFAPERPQDRDPWPASRRPTRQKLSSRHIPGATRRRATSVSSEESKRIPAEGCCTSVSSSDGPHHQVSFRWLKVEENVFKEHVSILGLDREPAIALPMVCLEGASARSSRKTLKGWEIIKSGMDYVLGRSIVPTTKQKPVELLYPEGKHATISARNASQRQRHSLDRKAGSASSSAVIGSIGTIFFAPRIQPDQVLASAQDSKKVAKTPILFKHDAIAGALAGMCVSLCLHPVDTIKTVIQAQSSGQRSIFHTLLTIISDRGFFGLYRGLGSNLASSAPISAIYTFTYESVKAALLPHLPKEYYAIAHCTAGGCASIATSIVYTPSECVKQRMQVGSLYRNSWLTFLGILKNGGISVLYSGWVAVLCRNVPQSVIKFYTYEGLKRYALSGQPDGTPLSTCQTLAFGGVAGSTAALFTTPFDVIKTRLQTQIPGSLMQTRGVFQAFQFIATSEGVGGLYRGLIPRVVIYISQGALFFATYEFFRQVLAMEVKKFTVLTCHSANVVGQGKVVEPT